MESVIAVATICGPLAAACAFHAWLQRIHARRINKADGPTEEQR